MDAENEVIPNLVAKLKDALYVFTAGLEQGYPGEFAERIEQIKALLLDIAEL